MQAGFPGYPFRDHHPIADVLLMQQAATTEADRRIVVAQLQPDDYAQLGECIRRGIDMKVAEVREKLQGHNREKLESIILEMYKAMPKSVKEVKGIDIIITTPNAKPKRRMEPVHRDLEDIREETEEFLSDAYNQYYFAPNSVIPKSKRPGWRFIVRRLFKELQQAAGDQDKAHTVGSLMKQLYRMLCYSCRYVLFSGNDPFDSVGIRQVDFFHAAITIGRKVEPPRDFIRNSILLAMDNDLNTHTLWEELLDVIVACLETADMKEMAIEVCNELRKNAAAGRLRDLASFSKGAGDYRAKDFVNNLAVLGWMCHMALEQPDAATQYFFQYYVEKNPEVVLYVLLSMIEQRQSWDLWLKTYENAVGDGIRPREELQRRFNEIRRNLHYSQ
jgi:hypothetical protein